MKVCVVRILAPLVALALLALACPARTGVAAEKTNISGTYKEGQVVSQMTISPGDAPGHELLQVVRLNDAIDSSNPDFSGASCTLYMQQDAVSGTGSHRGHVNCVHKSGDRSFFAFEGTHKVTIKEDKSWEVPYEGRFQWTGGTGRFKAIKGFATYRGQATPAGGGSSWEGVVEY